MRKLLFSVIFSFVSAGVTCAWAQDRPPYDGTGSQFVSWGKDKPPTAAETETSRKNTEKWLQDMAKDSDQGDIKSTLVLAQALMQGDTDIPIDRARAFDLYEKAAQKGDDTGREKMCVAYVLGEGRPIDLAKGMGYCKPLGTQNATALFAGGYDFEHGITGPKDEQMAVTLYVEAAKLGSAEAMDAMGVRALSLSKLEDARKWFRKGAASGSTFAMDHLAVMTEAGQGGPADIKEAGWLYVNAARRGNTHAMAWMTAQSAPPTPLPRSRLMDKDQSLITHTYVDKAGSHTEAFNGKTLSQALSGAFPSEAEGDGRLGTGLIHCYVNASHAFDVCIIQQESPPGYGYGRILSTLFGGKLTVTEKDTDGQPTAGTVFTGRFNWLL